MGANTSLPDKGASYSNSRSSTLSRYANAILGEPDPPVPKERKKKSSKLATLRKKLIRVRRHSRNFDYAKTIREFTSNWSIRELHALVEEYESSALLKELTIQANLARPRANTYKEDLSDLYDYKYCTDVDLIYQGACFPVHRAILSARCSHFKDLLAQYPGYGAEIPIHIRTPGIDVGMFSDLLRYLYTGEIQSGVTKLDSLDLLVQLSEEFGTLNYLETDLRTLLETSDHSDAVLVFSNDADYLTPETANESPNSKHELRCHKSILAARSPFFRNLLMRRARSGEEINERALQAPTRIVLDESVIPKQYARVLLHAIYLDSVDLTCVVRGSSSTCSLSEVQAMVSGKGHMTHTDEAMEIYQIGQFIDFPILSQGCEDIIVESLSTENLLGVLHWSSQPHGSQWVHRQALQYLREEFIPIAHSPVLCEMHKNYIIQAIQSDFLQAGELDVLTAVLKWGEHQLIKRMEEREPNLVSHTAHSVSKKGIKKRDLNDGELRDILLEILPHIRTDHILPTNHETLLSAIKRGLISTAPSHMIGDDFGGSRLSAWIRGKSSGMFIKPRFFVPYYEEVKAILDEQLSQAQEQDVVRLRTVHMSNIPDTLYMLEEKYSSQSGAAYHSANHHSPVCTVDIIAGTIPVPDPETLKSMMARELELQATKLAQRAYSFPCCDRHQVALQLQLRVVREYNLPDTTVEVLYRHGKCLYSHNNKNYESQSHDSKADHGRHVYKHSRSKSPQKQHSCKARHDKYTEHSRIIDRIRPAKVPPVPSKRSVSLPTSPVTGASPYIPNENNASSPCSDGVLSDIMPDIAMATSSIGQMSIQEPEMDLDLGDGRTSHNSTSCTLYL